MATGLRGGVAPVFLRSPNLQIKAHSAAENKRTKWNKLVAFLSPDEKRIAWYSLFEFIQLQYPPKLKSMFRSLGSPAVWKLDLG